MVRLKHRYFLMKIVVAEERFGKYITSRDLYESLRNTVHSIHGDYGLACIGISLNVKYLNVLTRLALVRVRRQFHRLLWSAIPLVKSIRSTVPSGGSRLPQNLDCILNTLFCSGTIRSVQRYIIQHDRKRIVQAAALKKSLEFSSTQLDQDHTDDCDDALKI